MKFYILAVTCFLLRLVPCNGQSLDGTITVDNVTRQYSIYLPSSYLDDGVDEYPAIVALHPLNTTRWNSRTWRDTLIDFAEANQLILVCPDGGADGDISSEPIDALITNALMDSAVGWFRVDRMRTYALGFSMGGRATYLYGLEHAERFAGLIPIGAVVSTDDFSLELRGNAKGMPIAPIHGALDAAETRFFPVVEVLGQAGAILFPQLLPGTGHTIDFDNRNDILSAAFRSVDSAAAAKVAGVGEEFEFGQSFPSDRNQSPAIASAQRSHLELIGIEGCEVTIYSIDGRLLLEVLRDNYSADRLTINTQALSAGPYLIRVSRDRAFGSVREIRDKQTVLLVTLW